MLTEIYKPATEKQRDKVNKFAPNITEVGPEALELSAALGAAEDHTVVRTYRGTLSLFQARREVPLLIDELTRAGVSVLAFVDEDEGGNEKTTIVFKLYKPEL